MVFTTVCIAACIGGGIGSGVGVVVVDNICKILNDVFFEIIPITIRSKLQQQLHVAQMVTKCFDFHNSLM